ncbi:SDR family oxidoreductase [Helicobacter sp. 14348-15]|uniref:SDR family oxidoreductase n=1 Tax=Helicobacter TaxID=209 RepID=UPI002029D7E3|nr:MULTISPECIES: SDR family oxidoreductase [Helicobacter]MCL9821287.1 SDR family oxidoreductase [Helicobacter colisuis]MCL9822745.1 SDR family oxidoreductase [Helicobacter colisuis]MDY5616133.1 SDR family oxidoreductase [Helicobacter sp.]
MLKVLITGASSGVGLEVARRFHNENFYILLVARSVDKLLAIKNELKNNIEVYSFDLMDRNSLHNFLLSLQSDNILPDIVIHNVGGRLEVDEQPLTYEALQQSMHLNLGIAVSINSFLLPFYVKRKKGYILHISSDSAINGEGAPGYVASKAALNAYIKSTARFYAKDNICINGVMPGIIEFEGSSWARKRQIAPKIYYQALSRQPLQRFATLQEISQFILLLVKAQNMQTTGQIYVLNGGK